MTETMSRADHLWLCMDDPTNRMMITAVMEFESRLDYERLTATVDARLSSFPRFRQRVVPPTSGVGLPSWEEDTAFDIRTHIVQLALPSPGGKDELQEMISTLMATPLDPNRPLWQIHLIEFGQQGCALFFRIHHCIADGIALIHVLLSTADSDADAPWPQRRKPPKARTSVSLKEMLPIGSVISVLQRAADAGFALSARLKKELLMALANPGHLLDMGRLAGNLTSDITQVLSRLTVMSADPKTAFKGRQGIRKTAAWTEPFPLARIKAIGGAIEGTTVNDVLIAVAAGAMRRYLITRNSPVNELDLRVAVPVNIRKPGTEMQLGNRFSLVLLSLPIFIEDPVLRLKEIKRRMDRLKNSADAMVAFGVLNLLGMLPSDIAKAAAGKLADKASAVLTNVPGPRQQLYFAGEKISNMMFWVPRSGKVGLGVSIFSYNQQVTMGIAADHGRMPDPELFLRGIEEELANLDETVRSGKLYDDPLVLHDRYQESGFATEEKESAPDAASAESTNCHALTRKGTACKLKAVKGSTYCHMHQKSMASAPPSATSDTGPSASSEQTQELERLLRALAGK